MRARIFSSWPGVPARAVEQRPLAPTGAPEILGPRRAARWEKYEFGRPRVGIAWGSAEASRRLVATGGASRGSLPNRDLAWCGHRDRHGAVVASRALAPASPAPFELPHRLAACGAASGELGAKEEHSPRGNRSGSTPDTALIPCARPASREATFGLAVEPTPDVSVSCHDEVTSALGAILRNSQLPGYRRSRDVATKRYPWRRPSSSGRHAEGCCSSSS